VPSEDLPDFVDDASPCSASLFAERCQTPVFLIRGGGDVDLPQTTDRLAREQPVSVDPEQFAERSRITSIRLTLLPFIRLNQDHLRAAVVSQHADQPIVKATDLKDRHELRVHLGELLKERFDLFGAGTNLSA
jgi:hypothetical protein